MTRSQFLLSLSGGLSAAALGARTGSAGRMPNIVFLLADDMGYGDPRCYNPESKIPTPNMDSLAEQGVRFTDAHTSASVCTPSRYGVLTGRYCWRTRLKKEVLWSSYEEPLIEPSRLTAASFLKRQGYSTACVGKWHLGLNFARKGSGLVRGKTTHMSGLGGMRDVDFTKPITGGPVELGFDYFFGLGAGINLEPFCFIENDRVVGDPSVWREKDTPTAKGESALESHEGWMTPGWKDNEAGPTQASKAIAFMERSRKQNPDKPFFLYFATQSPHRPCTPPAFLKNRSAAGVRGDMVAEFDWTLGEVTKALTRIGVAQDTLIIASSDNGGVKQSDEKEDFGHKSCGNLRGFKGGLYEGGHRVPFIARWPGKIQAGRVCDQLICLSDFLATSAALTGASLPVSAGEDSRDISPALLGKTDRSVRESIVHHDYGGRFGIRQGKWKLLLTPKAPELYDLQEDPAETRNLAGQHADVVTRLQALLERHQRQGHSRG